MGRYVWAGFRCGVDVDVTFSRRSEPFTLSLTVGFSDEVLLIKPSSVLVAWPSPAKSKHHATASATVANTVRWRGALLLRMFVITLLWGLGAGW